ncbi:MAG: ATP-binding protein, partial [Sphingomonadales bacterium]
FGYININFDANPLFYEIKSNLKMASGETHILEADGTWMFSRATNEDFVGHLGQEVSFKNHFPEIWNQVQGRDKGVLNLQGEIVVFDKILITPILEGQDFNKPALSISTMNQRFQDNFYLVSKITVPSYATLFRISPEQTFLIWGGYIVFTLLLSFWIAYLIATKTALQERARYSLKMEAVGELTSGVAHDFNNLLTAVIGNLGLLERENQSKTAQTLISNACDAAWRGAELTKRLLAFSRKQNLEPRELDLAALVKETERLVKTTLGEGLKLVFTLPDEEMMVRLDPLEFQNVVLNLAINARDAMTTGDHLSIKVYREVFNRETAKIVEVAPGAYIVTEITDTGEGMSPEVQKQAIDPFFTTKPIGEGSGLGLSMAYGFAKQSGGQLKIISEKGEGTTLLILIPEIE